MVLLILPLLPLAAATEVESVVSAGMGGVGVARPDDNGSVVRSAAAMVLEPSYLWQADAAWDGGLLLGTSLRDTRTSSFGAAAAYTWQRADLAPSTDQMPGFYAAGDDLSNLTTLHTTRASVGYAVAERKGGMGASLVYARGVSELAGVVNRWQADVSAAARPVPTLLIAATGVDLVPFEGARPGAVVGLWWVATPYLSLGADGAWRDDVASAGGALEVTAADSFHVRGGWRQAGAAGHLGAGAGWGEGGTRVDYAFGWDVLGGGTAGTTAAMTHTLGFAVAF